MINHKEQFTYRMWGIANLLTHPRLWVGAIKLTVCAAVLAVVAGIGGSLYGDHWRHTQVDKVAEDGRRYYYDPAENTYKETLTTRQWVRHLFVDQYER